MVSSLFKHVKVEDSQIRYEFTVLSRDDVGELEDKLAHLVGPEAHDMGVIFGKFSEETGDHRHNLNRGNSSLIFRIRDQHECLLDKLRLGELLELAIIS